MRPPLFFVALALALLVGPAEKPTLQSCSSKPVLGLREWPDNRVKSLVLEVLALNGTDIRTFAFCLTLVQNVPYLIQIRDDRTDRVLVNIIQFPHYMTHVSDKAIRGAAAHELSHVPIAGTPKSEKVEMSVDKTAAKLVGVDAVHAALTEVLEQVLKTYPLFEAEKARATKLFQDRLDALDASK